MTLPRLSFLSLSARAGVAVGVALLLSTAPQAWAQQNDSASVAAQQQALAQMLSGQVPPAPTLSTTRGRQAPTSYSLPKLTGGGSGVLTQDEFDMALEDRDSAPSKAYKLSQERKRQREIEQHGNSDLPEENEYDAPPGLLDLRVLDRHEESWALADAADGDAPDSALDLRRDAQKEASLSFGARGGLAHRNYEIMQRLHGFENTLDKVFNFRMLLVNTPSGLLIEPPIIRESLDSMVITAGGNEAAVADRVLDINKQAKIVSAPRDWREYLFQPWTSEVPPPPRILWPENNLERARWKDWVKQGWEAGVAQADSMFEVNLNRLTADYNGMVRYRMLLAEGMVSQPYAMHEDRGVTGTKTVMRVGDRALRITGPSQFLVESDLWKPADR